MTPWWSGTLTDLLAQPTATISGALLRAHTQHYRTSEPQILRAWDATIDILKTFASENPSLATHTLVLEYPLLRLGKRADAILLTDRAIIVLEFKIGAETITSADYRQAEDYALDLQDFHAGSRLFPIIPVLVATHANPAKTTLPLLLPGSAASVITTNSATLAADIIRLQTALLTPTLPLNPQAWITAAYLPVPTIIESARMLYARHGVADIKSARADRQNLGSTTDAIVTALTRAQTTNSAIVLFVTGIPGAGKTLCGLNATLTADGQQRATFLTGNPSLVHVLREALALDAIAGGLNAQAARQRMEGVIQALPKFRDAYVNREDAPPERVVVIDEAQRCWAQAHAIRKTRDKAVPLSQSEPAHLLDIMARHQGFCAIICLVGGGQEIHDGEGGLAEWGDALRARPHWQVTAAAPLRHTADPRQTLGPIAGFCADPNLHLDVSIRQIGGNTAPGWVDRVLAGDHAGARQIARLTPIPMHLTRDLPHLRASLRALARGTRRTGLLASSGAKRLRAEGLGCEVDHMDAQNIARWFLANFPADVRASAALEQIATEFSVQGLELDYVGLAWDLDLWRTPGTAAWGARRFVGTKWQIIAKPENIANQINTYRVLLTRARYQTIIYIPRGDINDPTRPPDAYDAIADFLYKCGATYMALLPPHPAGDQPDHQPLLNLLSADHFA